MNDHMETYNMLNGRVQWAKDADKRRGDLKMTAELIDDLAVKTIDGVVIRCGMRVVDYDMKWTTIEGIQSVAYADDGNHVIWFKTKTGMFDGQRLWAKMP